MYTYKVDHTVRRRWRRDENGQTGGGAYTVVFVSGESNVLAVLGGGAAGGFSGSGGRGYAGLSGAIGDGG